VNRLADHHYDACACGEPKKRTSLRCRRCANAERVSLRRLKSERNFDYFPTKRDTCLVAVRGYPINPSAANTGGVPERVAFTLCENFPPYRELLHLGAVRVEHVETKRLELIRAHCDPNYRPGLRVKRLRQVPA